MKRAAKPKRSLKELLLAMPAADEDADFERSPDRGRPPAQLPVIAVEEQDLKTGALATEEEMAKRKILADHIRDRMAKPATAAE